MMEKSLAALIVAGVMMCSACGAAGTTGTQTNAASTEGSASGAQQEAAGNAAAQSAEGGKNIVEVLLKDDAHADFIFYGDGTEPLSDVTVFTVSYGGYKVVLNDYERTGEFQCGVWTDDGNGGGTLLDAGKADYQINDDGIVISADMTGVNEENGFSFAEDFGESEVHYEYGDNGGPTLTFPWEDIVNRSGYTPGTKTAESATEQPETESATEDGNAGQNDAYWFMGKTLDSHGGNWGASHITLSGPDENGLPTKVTVTDSGVDVMGNPLDGDYGISIDTYEGSDEMDYLIGTYTGTIGAGIKGEFYDGDGRVLTLQID